MTVEQIDSIFTGLTNLVIIGGGLYIIFRALRHMARN